MDSEKTISVLVDSSDSVKAKSALPGFDQALAKVVDFSVDQLQNSATDTLEGIYSLLRGLPLQSGEFAVDEIRFTLRIDATGGVSVVSAAKASLGAQTGIEFTISRRS